MSWFLQHEMAIQESCNSDRYVKACVKKLEIPGKFSQDSNLLQHGIVFNQDEKYKNYQETGIPVSLPKGYMIHGDGNCLSILDERDNCIFFAYVVDNRGYATWYKRK